MCPPPGFGSSPPPPHPLKFSKLDRRHKGRLRKRDDLLTGERGEGCGGGAKSYHGEKAWSSINHLILSGYIVALCDHEECVSREQREHGEKSQVGNNQVREHKKLNNNYILD